METKLPYVALGMHKGSDGLYYVAKIHYNPDTKEMGDIELLSEGDIKVIAEDHFKIAVIKEGIFS